MMRRICLAVLLALGLTQSLAAVKAPKAPPSSPDVDTEEATVDSDLKGAVPPMKQGTEEPVGGFKESGLKGRSSLALDVLSADGTRAIGWNYWAWDNAALVARLGGSYQETAAGSFLTDLEASFGVRGILQGWGTVGHAYWQGTILYGHGDDYRSTKTPQTSYVQSEEHDVMSNRYGAALGLGTELFWPGSQRVSLDLGGQVRAVWVFSEDSLNDYTDDGVSGTNAKTVSSGRAFSSILQGGTAQLGLNIYF
jgi:hypothetical protein